jgi:hypothetical protein
MVIIDPDDMDMADWGRSLRDEFSDRELAFFLFDEPDYDAQQRAIRVLLGLRRKMKDAFASELKEIEKFVKTAKGSASQQAIDEWVDHLHNGVFEDAAHSMAAVGMLAPFIESLFEQAFRGIERLFQREGHVLIGPRAGTERAKRWDCHYQNNGRKDLVKGICQLSDATSLSDFLPENLRTTLTALYLYRNKNFHLGLEWPMAQRVKFESAIASNRFPPQWFDRSTSDGKPWVFYMSDEFVTHCLNMVEQVLSSLGAFYRAKST